MLTSCQDKQICTIYKIVTYGERPKKGKGDRLEVKDEEKPVEKNMYHIPTRNEMTGKIEINTLLKKDEFIPFNEIGPQQDFVKYEKPQLKDAPIDKQMKLDVEKLLEANKDAFAEDKRQIGTTPLIKCQLIQVIMHLLLRSPTL